MTTQPFTPEMASISTGNSPTRHIADGLSALNLTCGVLSIFFATQLRPDLSLVCLLAGALFDGLDGAAARRWGGTRFGVLADDIADGVNYGLAPGAALFFGLGAGTEGLVLGLLYTLLTLSRLVFFTLNKDQADPRYFNGVPSTIGGLVTLSALILFAPYTAVIGLLVGVACALMVSYDVLYKHLGRALARHLEQLPVLATAALTVLLVGMALWGPRDPAAVLLIAGLVYGFLPMLSRWKTLVVGSKGQPV